MATPTKQEAKTYAKTDKPVRVKRTPEQKALADSAMAATQLKRLQKGFDLVSDRLTINGNRSLRVLLLRFKHVPVRSREALVIDLEKQVAALRSAFQASITTTNASRVDLAAAATTPAVVPTPPQ